jgi:hypothetical protein
MSRNGGEALADSLAELMPHGDRDHFVYIWQRVADGKRLAEGVQVEHVQRSPESDEFEIVLSENGVPGGRLRMRDDGQQIALLDEDDLEQQLRLTFTPPLTQFEIPLVAGEKVSRSTATISSLTKESEVTSVDVSQVVRLSSARNVKSSVGNYPRGIGVETERTLHWPWGDAAYRMTAMLVPGLGEVRSEAHTGDEFVTRRELACAIIGGRAVGDCKTVEARIKALRDAGSADVR